MGHAIAVSRKWPRFNTLIFMSYQAITGCLVPAFPLELDLQMSSTDRFSHMAFAVYNKEKVNQNPGFNLELSSQETFLWLRLILSWYKSVTPSLRIRLVCFFSMQPHVSHGHSFSAKMQKHIFVTSYKFYKSGLSFIEEDPPLILLYMILSTAVQVVGNKLNFFTNFKQIFITK